MNQSAMPTPLETAVKLVLSGIFISLSPDQRTSALTMTEKLLNDFSTPVTEQSQEMYDYSQQVEEIVYRLLRGLPIPDATGSH